MGQKAICTQKVYRHIFITRYLFKINFQKKRNIET